MVPHCDGAAAQSNTKEAAAPGVSCVGSSSGGNDADHDGGPDETAHDADHDGGPDAHTSFGDESNADQDEDGYDTGAPAEAAGQRPLGPAGSPFDALSAGREVVRVGPRSYLKLECIGKGGSSRVYRVLGEDLCSYALKRVRLSRMDAASVASYSNEIALLKRLAGRKHIIRLLDAEVNYSSRCIHMVMEHGQMDLNKLVQTERERVAAAAASGAVGAGAGAAGAAAHGICMDGNLLRVVWQQMLIAVQTIHEARIVHGDLKPANFVFVEGTLKLIDFGIARAISNDTTNIVREGTVGTLNYMSPEAIQDVSAAPGAGGTPSLKLGRASDIWSLGCILYQMAYGRTPFADLPLIAKLHAIVDAGYVIPFPPCPDAALLGVMQACLQRTPSQRPTIAGAGGLLSHPLLNPQPHAQPMGLLLGQAEILERRAALRPVAPARSGEPADKENAGGAGSGKPDGVVRGRLPFGGPGAGNGLEAALRRGLSERFAHVVAAPSASARAKGGAGGGGVDTSVTMDLDTTATWVS